MMGQAQWAMLTMMGSVPLSMLAMMGGPYGQDWQSDKVQEQVVQVLLEPMSLIDD